jgi:hypothetical protein
MERISSWTLEEVDHSPVSLKSSLFSSKLPQENCQRKISEISKIMNQILFKTVY